MTKFTIAFASTAIIALFLLGCASFNEPPSEPPDGTPIEYDYLADDTGLPTEPPHGTPIGHDEIPEAMRARHDIPDDASVERHGDELGGKAYYRVQHADGTVYLIGPY